MAQETKQKILWKKHWMLISGLFACLVAILLFFGFGVNTDLAFSLNDTSAPKYPPLNKEEYDDRLYLLATGTTTRPEIATTSTTTTPLKVPLWPVLSAPYPKDGAILPFKRVIAYYGNLKSTRMGVLGEYPEEQMLAMLGSTTEAWTAADPSTPAIPALHYIAVTAQGSPGEDGMYRLRMPHTEIDKVLAMAAKINAIVFLDIQVGYSTIEQELPLFDAYLALPNVHLAIDPEFSMKRRIPPGKVVGTYDAADINWISQHLADIVNAHDLPPKIFIIHRYTQEMMTNYQNIVTRPEVQTVIHMDGWGGKSNKLATYFQYIYKEPVQFTGFKLFYKNDFRIAGTRMMTPEEVLREAIPAPIYIQYQ